MANQSILTGIRRLWEYMTVPSYGNIPIDDIEEEHDPVREFIERQSRGDVPEEVVGDENVLPKKRPGSKTTKSRQQDASDTSPPSTEAAVADSEASLNTPEDEASLQEEDGMPAEAESEVPQDVSDGEKESGDEVQLAVADDNPEETESEVSEMTVEEEHQEAEQIEGEQKEETQQSESDDLMDIFRNEKEIKEKDIIQEIIVDIDINNLLAETKELMAQINTRRYRKR